MLALLQPTSIRPPTDQSCGKPRGCGKLPGETAVSVIAYFLDHREYGEEIVGLDESKLITDEWPINGASDKLSPNFGIHFEIGADILGLSDLRRKLFVQPTISYCGQVAAGSRLMMGCEPETGTMGRRYGRPTVLWQE